MIPASELAGRPPLPTLSEAMRNDPYTKLGEILERMDGIAQCLIDSGTMNLGLSLKGDIEDLKRLFVGVRE